MSFLNEDKHTHNLPRIVPATGLRNNTASGYLSSISPPLQGMERTEEQALIELIESHKHLRAMRIALRTQRTELPRWKRKLAAWLGFDEYQ
jgi:hypothetical protein